MNAVLTDIDECQNETTNNCIVNAELCINRIGSYECCNASEPQCQQKAGIYTITVRMIYIFHVTIGLELKLAIQWLVLASPNSIKCIFNAFRIALNNHAQYNDHQI